MKRNTIPTIDTEFEQNSIADSLGTLKLDKHGWTELVSIPRWVIYFQAALLGIIASMFFVFGMMVGSLTSGDSLNGAQVVDCRVIGSVVYRDDGALMADEGAVILLLPKDRKPDVRSPGKLVSPATFKALDNVGIDRIHELGGAAVRADENGQFNVVIDSNLARSLEYFLLVVSNNVEGVSIGSGAETTLTKEQAAVIGTFFMPVEEVIDNRTFLWMKLNVDGKRIELPDIEF